MFDVVPNGLQLIWNGFVALLPVISTLALVLGGVGGIPELRRSMKPKSYLKVTLGEITPTAQPMGHSMNVTVLNQKKKVRRSMDAMDVIAGLYVIDRNHQQWSGARNISISPYLMEGVQVTKAIPITFSFAQGEPYTIVVLVASAGMTHYIRETKSHTA